MKSIIFMSILVALMAGCGKSNSGNTPCGGNGINGGVVGTGNKFYRTFYASVSYSGVLTVQVKDGSGTIVNPSSHYIVGYYPTGKPNCVGSGVTDLRVELATGQSYTYTATATGKSWNGSIAATCEANSCELVELK